MSEVRSDRPFGGLPFLGDTPPYVYEPVIDSVPRITSVSPNSSRTTGGITVTISGANFAMLPDGITPPTVTFGGVAATNVVVVNPATITCTNPTVADPAVVDIVVTIGIKSATGPGLFTYFESVITRITPNHGPISGGTSVLIEGYNFVNGSLVLFDGFQAGNIEFIDSQHITCTTPNHAVGFVDVDIIEPTV
jgi:hypothetical protein